MMHSKSALLIVDVQLDFCPGGALPVPAGDTIIPVLNKYIKLFTGHNLPVFASRDWHAGQTTHFQEFGGTWPRHCVQDTRGAQFHPVLAVPESAIILSKGMSAEGDSYSAFQAVDDQKNAFDALLRQHGITALYIGGLATDYCVKWTVLDGLHLGYKTTLLLDAIKGVDRHPRDSEVAIDEMTGLGAHGTTFEKLCRAMKETVKTAHTKGG